MCGNFERQDQEGLYQPLRTSFTKVFCQNLPDRDTGGATQSYLPRPSKSPHILTIFEGQMLVGQRSTQKILDPETEGSSASSLRVCTRPVWPLWRTKAARTMDEQSRIDPVNILMAESGAWEVDFDGTNISDVVGHTSKAIELGIEVKTVATAT